MNIVEFRNVSIDYKMKRYDLRAVNQVDFDLQKGKITALVGESGSGKTTFATALINCISAPGEIAFGSILYYGKDKAKPIDVTKLSEKELNMFRWSKVSMVFQGAQSSLNPVMKTFDQFYETLQVHRQGKITLEEAKTISTSCLEYVNLDATRILGSYPHELSGGMKQRAMIAFSLLLDPEIVILDEPTTALDVINQDYVFSILKRINAERNITMLLLTHDIAVVSKYADFVGVMYGGSMMEYGDTLNVFKYKYHPYTEGLINATPSLLKNLDAMRPIEGSPPNLLEPIQGCVFYPRCHKRLPICELHEPATYPNPSGGSCKCWLFENKVKS